MQKRLNDLPYFPWLICGIVSSGVFLSTLSASIVNIALPSIVIALKTDLPTVQWISTGYYLLIICLLPLLGRLGDFLGPFRIFNFGFLCVLGGSVLCGFAQSITVLIVARLVQALGAAMLIGNGNSIIVSSFPVGQRGKMLGFVGSGAALGPLLAPGLGGLVLEFFEWNAVFFVILPVAVLGFYSSKKLLPKENERRYVKIDYIGAGIFATGMVSLLLLLNHGMQWDWERRSMNLAFCVLAFFVFAWYEKKTEAPMIDFAILQNRTFLVGNLSGMLSWIVFGVNSISLPFFLQAANAAPSVMGLVMLVGPVFMLIAAPLSGRLSDRIGAQIPTVAGLGLMAIGSYYSSGFNETTMLWNIMIGQMLIGLGNGIFQAPNNNSVMSAVQLTKLGMAGGISALTRYFGLAVGTSMSMVIFEYQRIASQSNAFPADLVLTGNAVVGGYQVVMLVAAVVGAIGTIVSLNRGGRQCVLDS